jgi:hypothetical protein
MRISLKAIPKTNRVLGMILLLAGFFVSCASRPALVPWAKAARSEAPGETPSLPPLLIEEIVRQVKNNDPALVKYFLQDEERTISVKADAGDFEIFYDLSKARRAGDSRWEIDFSVERIGGGEVRQDTLLWNIPRDEAGILLSLDDNYEAQWRDYFDLFDRYGAKTTFFVMGNFSPFVPRPWAGAMISVTIP